MEVIYDKTRIIVEHPLFERLTLFNIALASILVGLETSDFVTSSYGSWLHLANDVVLWLFLAEMIMKLIAKGPAFMNFFRDNWNVFDTIIIILSFLPLGGYSIAFRLLRVARVLRLLPAIPQLRIIGSAIFRSLKSLPWVCLFMSIVFYVYAVIGVIIWGEIAPDLYGDLPRALQTLFRITTLEDWTDIMYQCEQVSVVGSSLYHISFVIMAAVIFLNLVTADVISNVDKAHAEVEGSEVCEIQAQLLDVQKQLTQMADLLKESKQI